MNILEALPYAKLPDKRQQGFITENYVCSPPALRILDEAGDVWALGLQYFQTPRDGYAFPVLLNGQDTGEWATKIERRQGKVRIFTSTGWKRWSGRTFI